MNEKTEELITKFKESSSYSIKVNEMDIRNLVGSEEFRNDLPSLLFFLRSAPEVHDYGSRISPGAMYIELCSSYVFPALSKFSDPSVAQAVCDAFINDKGYGDYEQYTKPAWLLLRNSGNMANEGLCRLVASRTALYSKWGEAVKLLATNHCKEAVPSIILGIANGYEGWKAWQSQNLTAGIKAIVALAAEDIGSAIDELLCQQDNRLRALIIRDLSLFGDRYTLANLDKRIKALVGKDSNPYVRKLIDDSVETIKRRNIEEGLEIEKLQEAKKETTRSTTSMVDEKNWWQFWK